MKPEPRAWNRYLTTIATRRSIYLLREDEGQISRLPLGQLETSDREALLARKVSGLSPALRSTLVRLGCLVSADHAETARVRRRLVEAEQAAPATATDVCLFLTHHCNLRCVYCIQGHEKKRGPTTTTTPEQIDAAFSFVEYALLRIEALRRPTGVTIYGGEPVQPSALPVLIHTLRRATEQDLNPVVVTNGYHYGALAPLLAREGLHEKVTYLVSVDGVGRAHDRRRPRADGGPTFDRIVRNVDLMLENGSSVSLQPVVDAANVGGLRELIAFASKRGWFARDRFQFRCGMVTINNAEVAPAGVPFTAEREIIEPLLRIARREGQIDPGFDAQLKGSRFPDAVLRTGAALPVVPACRARRPGTLCFSPDGYVYPCREFCGDGPSRAVGRYDPSPRLDEENVARWYRFRTSDHPRCRDCRHVLLCGGGCGVETETSGLDPLEDARCPDFVRTWTAYLEALDGMETDVD